MIFHTISAICRKRAGERGEKRRGRLIYLPYEAVLPKQLNDSDPGVMRHAPFRGTL